MNKGLFSIPVFNQNVSMDKIIDEITDQVINADKWGLNEAFFGEHITDKHEKITSSLLMVSSLSKLTKKIKLGTLTTNLNFHNPAIVAAMISMADNLSKGRLILGIGSGANMSDIESIGFAEKNNHEITLEIQKIIEKLFISKSLIEINSKNYNVSTKKYGDEELGLGYFNSLYNDRNNLEIVMPALNENSYNVKLCAKNGWSIVISNFCSEEIIDNHISNYLDNSSLPEEEAYKKIKLSKLIFANNTKDGGEELVFSNKSPFMEVVSTLFKKLKKYNKHKCFGKNINTSLDAGKNTILYGNPDEISKKIQSKYKRLSSIIYVTVPMTGNDDFDKSLEIFSKNVAVQ